MFRSFSLLLLSAIQLSACIIIPIPTSESKVLEGRAVREAQQVFLQDGVTTRQEVIGRLGNPDVIWVEGHIFCYNWTVRRGILVYAIPGGAGSTGARDLPKDYVLLLQFDEQDRLVRHEQVERSKYHSYGSMLREWVAQTSKPSGAQSMDSRE